MRDHNILNGVEKMVILVNPSLDQSSPWPDPGDFSPESPLHHDVVCHSNSSPDQTPPPKNIDMTTGPMLARVYLLILSWSPIAACAQSDPDPLMDHDKQNNTQPESTSRIAIEEQGARPDTQIPSNVGNRAKPFLPPDPKNPIESGKKGGTEKSTTAGLVNFGLRVGDGS